MLSSVALSLWRPEWAALPAIMLFGGGALALVGIYYANRWVKKPRPEDIIDQALKGLSNQHCIYHYVLPCDHLLLTPNGLIVIETCSLEGKFTYQDGKWCQKITPGRAMRFFVEEKLGDPIQRGQACAELIQERLAGELPQGAKFSVETVVLFTHPFAEVRAVNAPAPVCQPKTLSNRLPKKSAKLARQTYEQIRDSLDRMAGLADSGDKTQDDS